jgi:UDP-N-acetylmuramoyl-tripeptide--D-alanyl-D-alanine ligase
MKKVFKKIVEMSAGRLAKKAVEKNNPLIVGVTGSLGKTSAKEAIYTVLKSRFSVSRSRGSLNSELGLPLAIAGFAEGKKTDTAFWLGALKKLRNIASGKEKIKPFLILEMGAGKPGDIKKLVAIAPPKIAVITNATFSHLKYFKNLEATLSEKTEIIKNLPVDGWAVVCGDDLGLINNLGKTKAAVLTFGLGEKNLIRASNLILNFGRFTHPEEWGMSFKLMYKERVIPVRLWGALGRSQIYAVLAGAAVGTALGMNLLEIGEALSKYRSPRGRLNILKGMNGSIVLDDTYNASAPKSMVNALEILKEAPAVLRIAVLGDMLELGEKEVLAHREVGLAAAGSADVIFTIGEAALEIHRMVKKKIGASDKKIAEHFLTQQELIEALKLLLDKKVVALVKGSQGMRMEKIVKEILEDPSKAPSLLIRQEEEWLMS